MNYLDEIDYQASSFGELYDELPLWSARFGAMLLDQVTLRPGMTILDVGSGTGFLAIELAQRCGATSTVYAVDPWEAGVVRMKRKLERLGIDNVRPIVQDIGNIDLADESVDLIVSNLGINNFDNPTHALRSCFRVAKPGAELFLTTNLIGHMHEFYEVFRIQLVEGGFADEIKAFETHINHRATVESVKSLLNREGFDFLEASTSSFKERFVDGSSMLRHYFMRLGFVPAWKSIAPQTVLDDFFLAVENRLNVLATSQGELSLTIPTACIHARKP